MKKMFTKIKGGYHSAENALDTPGVIAGILGIVGTILGILGGLFSRRDMQKQINKSFRENQ